MSVNSEKINFASILGVESIVAPIVFAAAYVPLFAWFVRRSIGRRLNYVFVALAIFCSIRIAAFIIRAILAGSRSAGENLKLYITDVVLFSVGFFALLYSAYTLVLDRWLLLDVQPACGVIRLAHNRRIFRVVVLTAVTLGVVGSSKASNSDAQEGQVYRTASTIIFLVLTVVLAAQTVRLALAEGRIGFKSPGTKTLGGEYGAYILCLIAALLLLREGYTTATVGRESVNEHLWYPLFALPEFFAVVFYATPGLVPPRSELPK